jgi:hypothetical protein
MEAWSWRAGWGANEEEVGVQFAEPVDADGGVVDVRVASRQAEHEVSETVVDAAPSSGDLPTHTRTVAALWTPTRSRGPR